MAYPDLSAPLYAALTGDATIAAGLATYEGSPAVFTRRPVPALAAFPLCIAAGDIAFGDQDFLNDPLPVIIRDIGFYGSQGATDAGDYRTVESLAYRARDIFHRQRDSITVSGWNVVDIRAHGPIVAPTDDDTTVARIVTLQIRLSLA